MKTKTIPLDLIDEPKYDVRTYLVEEELDELGKSILTVGLLQPLRVFENDGRYEIEDGHRRFLAAKRAGVQSLPCIIVTSNERERDLKKLHANLHSEKVTPLETSRTLHRLKDEFGYTIDELTAATGKDKSRVYQLLGIMKFHPDILEALENRMIGENIARALNRLDDPEKRNYYLRYTIDGGATIDTVRAWVSREEYFATLPDEPHHDYTGPPEEHETVYVMARCACCRQDHRQDGLMIIRTCPECYTDLRNIMPDIYRAIKQEREGKFDQKSSENGTPA